MTYSQTLLLNYQRPPHPRPFSGEQAKLKKNKFCLAPLSRLPAYFVSRGGIYFFNLNIGQHALTKLCMQTKAGRGRFAGSGLPPNEGPPFRTTLGEPPPLKNQPHAGLWQAGAAATNLGGGVPMVFDFFKKKIKKKSCVTIEM
jgi:hypothetical protein